MNKALPWNVNGVGFDAREAAREAARRQGKSLGEWLHGVIADHATDAGVDESEIDDRRRIEAVRARLERLGSERGRGPERKQDRFTPRLVTREDRDERDDRRTRRRDDDEAAARRRPTRDFDETDRLLDDAIDAMERRAARAERHTDAAFDSLARMLERNEAQRERERSSVVDLADKLSAIEARLSDRSPHGDDNPIRSALTRLEARLDTIGRRGAAEAAAQRNIGTAPSATSASSDIGRFEEKLNAILDALHLQTGSASPAAVAAAHARPARTDRRLGEAIADIAKRQRSLEDGSAPVSLQDAILRRREPTTRRPDPQPDASPFAAMHAEIAALSERVDGLRRDMSARPQAQPPVDFEGLRAEVGTMATALRDLTRGALMNRPASSADGTLTKIEDRLDDLASQINQAMQAAPARDGRAEALASADFASLETLVRDLSERIDTAQAPGAGQEAIDALQAQIAKLSTRFEQSDPGLGKLASLERSMQDLFAQLDQTRAVAETSAARAAHEAVKAVIEETGMRRVDGSSVDLAAVKALQSQAEARTSATLSAVHETLEKVVDRLAVMEGDIAKVRDVPKAARGEPSAPATARPKTAARPQARDIPLGAPEPMFDSGLGMRPSEPKAPRAPSSLDEGDARAGFIAAARRAAKAAQSDPAVADLKRPEAKDGPARAGLAEQSRDYVARHKRPVLLGIAALFMIMGTMAIMQRIGVTGGDAQFAALTSPPAIERTASSMPSVAASDALTPSALPKKTPAIAAQIPGSDPTPTASMPSLPAFAAQSAGRPAAAAQLPSGLTTMAKSGDPAAEYVLGTQYTEGRVVPRDFKVAAQLFQKAADHGVVPAQYRLASLYEKGLGVDRDKAKAKTLYLQAAEAGNPRAMHNLAVLLADGDGHPDYEGAVTWFRKAAQYGIHDSQYNLAILLARGLGAQQSMVQSYQWFAVAAASQADADAAKKRDEVGARLASNDLAVAKALAAAFHPRIADIAATEVSAPPGGWDGVAPASSLNSPRQKISSL